jgi:hypothetical protein
MISKERNSRVFDRKAVMPWVLSESIFAEGRLWKLLASVFCVC